MHARTTFLTSLMHANVFFFTFSLISQKHCAFTEKLTPIKMKYSKFSTKPSLIIIIIAVYESVEIYRISKITGFFLKSTNFPRQIKELHKYTVSTNFK